MNTLIPAGDFKQGDTVHIISPSAGLMPFIQERVKRAQTHLESLGYRVVTGKSAAKNDGYVSASIEDRVADIQDAFLDPNCSLILCSIGGNHSNQLLDKINYDLIRNNPKAFCGYSDITVLHLAILAKTGLQTYYGPTFLNQFGEFPEVLPFTLNSFKHVVMQTADERPAPRSEVFTDEILDWFSGLDGERPRIFTSNAGPTAWKEGSATGSALPFTIPSINHVINTDYMPEVESPILMIDIPEGASMHNGLSVGEFDSWFSDLINAGLVGHAAGIAIGRAYKYTPEMITELQKVVLSHCRDLDIPIVYGLDFGHTDPMMSIQYLAQVTLDTTHPSLLMTV